MFLADRCFQIPPSPDLLFLLGEGRPTPQRSVCSFPNAPVSLLFFPFGGRGNERSLNPRSVFFIMFRKTFISFLFRAAAQSQKRPVKRFSPVFSLFLNANNQCHDQMVLRVRRDLLTVSIVLWGSEVSLSKELQPVSQRGQMWLCCPCAAEICKKELELGRGLSCFDFLFSQLGFKELTERGSQSRLGLAAGGHSQSAHSRDNKHYWGKGQFTLLSQPGCSDPSAFLTKASRLPQQLPDPGASWTFKTIFLKLFPEEIDPCSGPERGRGVSISQESSYPISPGNIKTPTQCSQQGR